jgi:hypothetical protein
MANTDIAALNPALEQFIRQRVVKQYNRSTVTLNLIQKQVGMGKNLAWDVSVGTGTGQVFDDGQTVSTFSADVEVLATLPWAEYGDALKITGRAEDGAQFSNTELGNTWVFKLMQARERAAKLVNDDIWTGDGSGSPQKLFGLTKATGGPLSVSGTYAGTMDRSTYPQTAGITLGNGGIPRAISLSLIEYGFEQVFNASGKIPTFGVTTSNIWRLLCELDNDKRRVLQEVYVRGQKLNISLGFNAVEVNGVPVFKDISVPSGYLAFFSEDSIAMEYLPTAPARIARGKVMATVPLAGLPQEQDYTGAPAGSGQALIANVIALPSAGNFESWMIDATIGLKVDRPNAHLLIKDIQFRAE